MITYVLLSHRSDSDYVSRTKLLNTSSITSHHRHHPHHHHQRSHRGAILSYFSRNYHLHNLCINKYIIHVRTLARIPRENFTFSEFHILGIQIVNDSEEQI
jgi:hypothetical protein